MLLSTPTALESTNHKYQQHLRYADDATLMGFPTGSGKESTCQCRGIKETQVQFLGWEDPMEEGMATAQYSLRSRGQRAWQA